MSEEKIGKKILDRFRSSFFGSDISNIGDYLYKQVVVPSTQDLASNIVDSTLSMLANAKDVFIYGETRNTGGRNNYRKAFDNKTGRRSTVITSGSSTRTIAPTSRGGRYCFDGVYFTSLADCNDVLGNLGDTMEEYGRVSVVDFVDYASDYTTTPIQTQPVDYNWGWTDLTSAAPKRVTGGWIIKLPPVVYLKK